MNSIIGHTTIRNRLEKLFIQQAIPHALLFSGPRGTGKKLVAIELYKTIRCQTHTPYGGCDNCKPCHLLDAGSLQDFTILNCEERETTNVERIRQVLYELHLKAAVGDKKILILDNAEHLSEQAQNIFLKALEEPRKDTYFCLVTSSLSRLLKTVQSRCQVWHFNALSTEEITDILSQRHTQSIATNSGDLASIARLADGSLENIDQLIEKSDAWKEMEDFIRQLKNRNLHAVFEIIQARKAKKDELRPLLAMLRILARDAMQQTIEPDDKFAWSIFLTNCLEAEPLILDRNLSAELVLNNLALSYIEPSSTLPFTSVGNDATVFSKYTV